MPVVFIVDPAIDEDVHEITLSYTFFIQPGSEDAKVIAETEQQVSMIRLLHLL